MESRAVVAILVIVLIISTIPYETEVFETLCSYSAYQQASQRVPFKVLRADVIHAAYDRFV
jgi:hypothetical protein